MTFIDVICDADNELPVPSASRKQLELIAQAFNAPDPSTALSEIENVSYRDGIVKSVLVRLKTIRLHVFLLARKHGCALYIFGRKVVGMFWSTYILMMSVMKFRTLSCL